MNTNISYIINKFKKDIVRDWVDKILAIPGTNYQKRPLAELYASTEEGMVSFLEIFEHNNYQRLDEYLQKVCDSRINMGFTIEEVTQALMLSREVFFPYALDYCKDNFYEIKGVAAEIDLVARYCISKFSELFAQGLNRRLNLNLEELREHEIYVHKQKIDLERKVIEITSLNESVQIIVSSLELDKVLNYIMEKACGLMSTEKCLLYKLDEPGHQLTLLASSGFPEPKNSSKRTKSQPGSAFMELVMKERQVRSISDINNFSELKNNTFVNTLNKLNLRATIAGPLVNQTEIVGGLALFYPESRIFADDDISLFTTFTNIAAIAIENARLYKRSQEAAILEERNRLAREIHDNLAQGLTAIVLQLEIVDILLTKDPSRIHTEIEKAKHQARRNLQEARRSVWDLRAGAAETLSIEEMIKLEIDRFKLISNIDVHLQQKGKSTTVLPEANSHIFRVFQESINNVYHHAQATNVWINLEYTTELLILTIQDDGIGLKSIEGKNVDIKKGFGLMGMQERARILKGSVNISSSEGKGTTVTLKVPLQNWLDNSSTHP
jgi:signal transduction histidine kinase